MLARTGFRSSKLLALGLFCWRAVAVASGARRTVRAIGEVGTRAAFAARIARRAFALATRFGGRRHFHPVFEDRCVEVDAGLGGQCLAKLVAQDACLDFLDGTLRQLAELEGPEGHADQPVDLQAEGFQHALHFAVLAFAQAERQPGIGTLGAVEHRLDAGIVDAIDGDAMPQRVERCLIGVAMGPHAVAPQPAGGRQFELAGEATIIGEQQQAFGIDVQPADGNHAGQAVGQRFEDGRAAFRVARRGHEAARLVVEPQACALPLGQRLAIDEDPVAGADIERRTVDDLAVHLDAAGGDPFLRVAARAQAGARHDLGDALFALVAFMGAKGRGRRFCTALALCEIRLAPHRPVAAGRALAEFGVAIAALREFALALELALAVRLAVVAGTHKAAALVLARFAELARRARTALLAGFEGACAILAEAASSGTATRFAGTALVVVSFVVHAS